MKRAQPLRAIDMKILHCPLNGPRNISEFIYGGEVEAMPDHHQCSAEEWAEFLYFHENPAGVVKEWWCHSATSYWFIVERHTISDEIMRTYPANELFTSRQDFTRPALAKEKAPTKSAKQKSS